MSEINRWAARYRAAASFEGAKLAEYQSGDTVVGYSALIRATVVWSAFERYLPLIGLTQQGCADLLQNYAAEDVAATVAKIDTDRKLYSYVRSRVTNTTLANQLDAYQQGDPFNVSYLLSALRHIFGHSHLTPGSNETDAKTTTAICDLLSEFHLRVMDSDFSKHVDDFDRMMDEGYGAI